MTKALWIAGGVLGAIALVVTGKMIHSSVKGKEKKTTRKAKKAKAKKVSPKPPVKAAAKAAVPV